MTKTDPRHDFEIDEAIAGSKERASESVASQRG